jgi:hypothetical protein
LMKGSQFVYARLGKHLAGLNLDFAEKMSAL